MLQNRVAIVTGGGSGIGRAAALIMAREGAKLVVADISEPGGLETVRDIETQGGEALYCATDVTREEQVVNLVDTTVRRFGRLDCACNNAGFGNRMALTADLDIGDWTPVLNLCLLSTFLCMKYEIAAMLKTGGGAIVNTSSNAALKGVRTQSVYSAAKAGVNGLTRTTAIEYAPLGIEVRGTRRGLVGDRCGHPPRQAGKTQRGRGIDGMAVLRARLIRDGPVNFRGRRQHGAITVRTARDTGS